MWGDQTKPDADCKGDDVGTLLCQYLLKEDEKFRKGRGRKLKRNIDYPDGDICQCVGSENKFRAIIRRMLALTKTNVNRKLLPKYVRFQLLTHVL